MALKVGALLPPLDGIEEWMNGAVSVEELRGHPVLFDFWALSCPYCIRNLPRLHEWRDRYNEQGLKIVAVHLPMRDVDRSAERVRVALEEHGIREPCALDHQGVLAERFETRGIWPYYFLFDAQGAMRSRAAGTSGLQLLEKALQRSLALSVVS
jgi:thiol-disulfide isomerase/thioredoxin